MTNEPREIAWVFTGAGHLMEECASIALESAADIYLTRAAEEVMPVYRIRPDDFFCNLTVYTEKKSSTPESVKFFSGRYKLLVIAPASSNTVAKMVHGIADSLATTMFAQAGKALTPIIVLPTDTEEVVYSMGATKPIKIHPRKIDLDNARKLELFENVIVVKNIAGLGESLARYGIAKR